MNQEQQQSSVQERRPGLFSDYDPGAFYCEMLGEERHGLTHTELLCRRIDRLKLKTLHQRAKHT